MDAEELFRLFSDVLTEIEGLISDLRDTAEQYRRDGRVDDLPAGLQHRLSGIRYTPVVPPSPRQRSRHKPPRQERRLDEFLHDGFAQIELHARGRDVRVVIPGLEPTWISPKAAVALEALAEPAGLADGKLVAFKTVPELARRIAELTGSSLKPHSVVSTIARLRKALPQLGLIDRRTGKGVVTAYRFPLLAGGRIIKHPPDFPAIGAATEGDR